MVLGSFENLSLSRFLSLDKVKSWRCLTEQVLSDGTETKICYCIYYRNICQET